MVETTVKSDDLLELVKSITFGSRVAEDETDDLVSYFVKTETWRKVRDGEVDVVLAPKGSGKSAIYSMLLASEDELFDERVLLAPGENMTGAPAFELLAQGTPSEAELMNVWKLYFLVLISQELESYNIESSDSRKLFAYLRDADLLPEQRPRTTLLAMVREYVGRLLRPQSAETSVHLDSATGAITGWTGKIEFSEPSVAASRNGHVSVDNLFALAEHTLADAGYTLWIVLDRLDAAFAASPVVERNALRALFRVYADLGSLRRITLKIFLRSDIWEDVTDEGFREASHIVRDAQITWDDDSLRQLIVRRLTQSAELCAHYGVAAERVLASSDAQQEFFYRVFAPQVDAGSGKTETFDWCITRTRDGKQVNAPRELIHLFSEARDAQITRFEVGAPLPEPPALFHPKTFESALLKVSQARLTKTIYAEFTDVKPYIEKLKTKKTEQNLESLALLWGTSPEDTSQIARRLVNIGLFSERRTSRTFWVPFMYRPALEMVQGKAEEVGRS